MAQPMVHPAMGCGNSMLQMQYMAPMSLTPQYELSKPIARPAYPNYRYIAPSQGSSMQITPPKPSGTMSTQSTPFVKPRKAAAVPQDWNFSGSKTSRRNSGDDSDASTQLSDSADHPTTEPVKLEVTATCKRPKKKFNTAAERDTFVRNYQIKLKTEMCRNWELFGCCKF